jgi:hypothetical protein
MKRPRTSPERGRAGTSARSSTEHIRRFPAALAECVPTFSAVLDRHHDRGFRNLAVHP